MSPDVYRLALIEATPSFSMMYGDILIFQCASLITGVAWERGQALSVLLVLELLFVQLGDSYNIIEDIIYYPSAQRHSVIQVDINAQAKQ